MSGNIPSARCESIIALETTFVITFVQQNVDTHDAHSHISAHASEDRRGAVVEGRVLLDGPSLFSDFEDFESEED